MWTYKNLDYKFNLVKDALIDRVVITEDADNADNAEALEESEEAAAE